MPGRSNMPQWNVVDTTRLLIKNSFLSGDSFVNKRKLERAYQISSSFFLKKLPTPSSISQNFFSSITVFSYTNLSSPFMRTFTWEKRKVFSIEDNQEDVWIMDGTATVFLKAWHKTNTVLYNIRTLMLILLVKNKHKLNEEVYLMTKTSG